MSDSTSAARRGERWFIFAGSMLVFAGLVDFIWGVAAIDGSAFFIDAGRFESLQTWGWCFLLVGLLQFIAAYSVFYRGEVGRFIGIFCAGVNALALLFTVSALILQLAVNAFAIAAFMLCIVDVLVIYGLATAGAEPPRQHSRQRRRSWKGLVRRA